MLLLNINGPINAGKTTVAKLLAQQLPGALFIEVDDLLSDVEQEELGLDFKGSIALRLERLDALLRKQIAKNTHPLVIFAYPMSEGNYARWIALAGQGVEFKSVTLSPDLEACLTNRGTRDLAEWETNRIQQMYDLGYHNPPQADLVINNTHQTPQQTVEQIISHFSLKELSDLL